VVFLPVAIVDKCLQFLFRLGWELLRHRFNVRAESTIDAPASTTPR